MAKRKRLTPPAPQVTGSDEGRAPETKSIFPSYPLGVASTTRRAPIADVAGAAAATAALSEVTAELEAARAEGRLVQSLPLEVVEEGHLVRDRLTSAVADDEMQSLMQSLQTRGQQTPIEVMETTEGHYGLISGWRRLSALRRLHADTGAARFATVRALVRRPDTAADAYVAMVEENEIRVGLCYYERARIVIRAVETGVCETEKEALNRLFASASRAKRSKIKSFIPVVELLGEHLKFPTNIGERLGLELSGRLRDPSFAASLESELAEASFETAEQEGAFLAHYCSRKKDEQTKTVAKVSQNPKDVAGQHREEVAPGVFLHRDASGLHISGKGVDDAIEVRVRRILSD